MTSRSNHHSSASDHCNHGAFDVCQCDQQTNDSPSTRFLYIGRSFTRPSAECAVEFKDCSSDTEMHRHASEQLQSTRSSATTSECNNYKQMLKQIISMSQRVLERIEKGERQPGPVDPPCAERMPSCCPIPMSVHIEPVQIAVPFTLHFKRQTIPPCPAAPCTSVQQRSQPCIQSSNQPSNQPSVQRSIQFSIQQAVVSQPCSGQPSFQSSGQPPCMPAIDCSVAQQQGPPPPCKESALELQKLPSMGFPISRGTTNKLCVSQGRFPQEDAPLERSPNADNRASNLDMICVAVLQNEPAQPPQIPDYGAIQIEECDAEDIPEGIDTDEKSIQVGKSHAKKKEECPEADSYGLGAFIIASAEFIPGTQILEIKVSRTQGNALVPTESINTQDRIENVVEPSGSNARQSLTLQNPEVDSAPQTRGSITRQSLTLPNSEADSAPQPRGSNARQSKTSQNPEARGSAPKPRRSTSNAAVENPVPENAELQVATQTTYDQSPTGRASNPDTRVSFSKVPRQSANAVNVQQQNQLQELLKEQELYDKPPPPLDENGIAIAAQIPLNMNYPSQFRQAFQDPNCSVCNEPIPNEQLLFSACFDMQGRDPIPVCCRCKRRLRNESETSCFSTMRTVQTSSKSSVTMSVTSCITSIKVPSCTASCQDVYLSANSDSDAEKKAKCKDKKKKKKTKKCSSSSQSLLAKSKCNASVLEILERMMHVLECMEASKNNSSRCVAAPPCDNKSQQTSCAGSTKSARSSSSKHTQRGICECTNEFASVKSDGSDERESPCAPELKSCASEPEPCASESKPCASEPKPCATPCPQSKPCGPVCPQSSKPCIIITLDPETGRPCYTVSAGSYQSSCNDIPCVTLRTPESTPSMGTRIVPTAQCLDEEEEELPGNICIRDEMQIINETHIQVIATEECLEYCDDPDEVRTDTRPPTCAETQTENCYGPFPATDQTELLDQLCAFREELSETCSCSYREISEDVVKLTSSGFHGECDCCHCRAERNKDKASGGPCCQCCKQELKALVDSVILDLESMEMTRRQNERSQAGNDGPPKHSASFPVTIMEVTELGKSSLYVKWAIHDGYGVGGYEIYVDNHLTNRYFNSRHEEAVVCNVDVSEPHRIALLARPKEKCNKTVLGAGDVFMEEADNPIPSHWVPSTYLYEPSRSLDYTKCF